MKGLVPFTELLFLLVCCEFYLACTNFIVFETACCSDRIASYGYHCSSAGNANWRALTYYICQIFLQYLDCYCISQRTSLYIFQKNLKKNFEHVDAFSYMILCMRMCHVNYMTVSCCFSQDVMLEFRAGRMNREGTRVVPDSRKGLVRIGRVCTMLKLAILSTTSFEIWSLFYKTY